MIKAFNSIKEIFLEFYQVLFVEAKDRYEVTLQLENQLEANNSYKEDITDDDCQEIFKEFYEVEE